MPLLDRQLVILWLSRTILFPRIQTFLLGFQRLLRSPLFNRMGTGSCLMLGLRDNWTCRHISQLKAQILQGTQQSAIYSRLYGEGEAVPWDQIVWIAGGIPKQSFLCWLFVLNRCPTRDRLLRWGLQTPPTCLLCNLAPQFFSCTYAWELWLSQSRRSGLDPQRNWDAVTTQLQAFSSRSWRGRLILLSWQSCIYWIWQERNGRLHRNAFRSVEGVDKLIDRIASSVTGRQTHV